MSSMNSIYSLLAIALLLNVVNCQNLDSDSALSYLSKYGYLSTPVLAAGGGVAHDDNGEVEADSQQNLNLAVRQFQRFAGLDQTGELDDTTLEMMSSPRCGVRDVAVENETLWRQDGAQDDPTLAKFQLYGTRWPRSRWNLKYKIIKYSRVIDRASTDAAFKEAFSMWEGVSNLKFSARRSGDVDITISFDTYSHGDNSPFDGLGGTLAHAYFPTVGEIHMDDSEQWTVNSYSGTSLLWVAVHEIGHSLGLKHSEVKSAIMTPFYQGYNPNKQLHQDDINGIQANYGKKKDVDKPTTVRPTSCPLVNMNTRNRLGVSYVNEVSSWEKCSSSCRSSCQYWTWHHEGAGKYANLCVLMEDYEETVPDSNALSGSRLCGGTTTTTIAPPPSCIQENTNTRDRELSTRHDAVTSWRACADICKWNPNCMLWTWHHEDAGEFSLRCFVMAGFGNKVEDGNAITGERGCGEETVCFEEDTNTRERHLSTRIDDVSSWTDCAALCRKKTDCKFWTWHHAEAGEYSNRCLIMAGFGQKVQDVLAITGKRDCY